MKLEYTVYRVGIFEYDGGYIESLQTFDNPLDALAYRDRVELEDGSEDHTYFIDIDKVTEEAVL